MGTTGITTVDTKTQSASLGFGDGGNGPFDPGGGDSHEDDRLRPEKYKIGIWVALFSIVMLFAALISAYVLRQTRGLTEFDDWQQVSLPSLLWVNTAILVVSSISMEAARRALGRGMFKGFSRWISLTTLFGVLFLIGQIVAWRQLVAEGVYVNTTPHGSFFYVLTGLHGLHIFGGVLALGYVTIGALRFDFGPARRTAVDVTAIYWHFMDGLWVFLFLLLSFWR